MALTAWTNDGEVVERHVLPHLGSKRLADLSPMDINTDIAPQLSELFTAIDNAVDVLGAVLDGDSHEPNSLARCP